VKFANLVTVRNKQGDHVVMNRNGAILVVDEKGRERERYPIIYGARVKVADGQPVTAADCVASIRRWASRDPMGQTLQRFIATLDATDDKTIKLVLKEPYGLVLNSLAKIGAPVPFMMPARIAATPGAEQVKEIIGSGPYRFRADLHEPGVKIVLEKFADYVPRNEPPVWASGGKVAKMQRVELMGIADPQTQVNALIAGEVDYLERVPADLLPLFTPRSGAKAEVVSALGYQAVMRLNHLQPPFNDPKVRRAIAMEGTCTGEHGVGLGKQGWLGEELGEAVEVMRDIKRLFDPDNLLNPGKLVPL